MRGAEEVKTWVLNESAVTIQPKPLMAANDGKLGQFEPVALS
jgi:hypothetical protein